MCYNRYSNVEVRMKKLKRQDIVNIVLLMIIPIAYFIWVNMQGDIYGSSTDFINQHFRLPEYLRILFYNGALLPNFAFHLGGGQNIFYLAYHGLFNPVLMLSYLLPFMKMYDFVVISNITCLLVAICLMYRFIYDKYNSKIALLSTFLFTVASPLIYHTHRHLMFVNYMVFLVMALIYVDKYFKTGKRWPLIISICLIILSSYLYSVSALFAILIYAIYKYIEQGDVSVKSFFKVGGKFLINFILPIGICAFLLLPTLYIIISGRDTGTTELNILELFIPSANSLYSSYSLGLTCFVILALLINLFNKKKEWKFLSISLLLVLLFPIFNYIFNGFMYNDAKSLIPFLPLYILIIANALNNFKLNKKIVVSFILGLILLLGLNLDYDYIYILVIDGIIMTIALLIYRSKKEKLIILVPLLLISLGTFIVVNSFDNLVTIDKYNEINSDNEVYDSIDDDGYYRVANLLNKEMNVNNILDGDYMTSSIYTSLANNYYTSFVRNVFMNEIITRDYHTITTSENLLFNIFMGNKYIISDHDLKGYRKVNGDDKASLYINDDAFSLGYSSDKLMSLDEFETLEYPYTIDALMNYIIVDQDLPFTYDSKINKYEGKIEIDNISGVNYDVVDGKYVMDSDDDSYLNIKLDDSLKDKILIVTMDMNYEMSCKDSTRTVSRIDINGISNVLSCDTWKYHNRNNTFHYVISSNDEIDNLEIMIKEGHYEISNFNIYYMDYNDIRKIEHDEFMINDFTGDMIKGTIDVSNDGYFMMSVPYDDGFEIMVDGKVIDTEMVDTSFIGFPISKGNHDIVINYKAPWFNLGKLISGICVIILIGVIVYERKGNKSSKENKKRDRKKSTK